MKKIIFVLAAFLLAGGGVALAAPISSAGVTAASSDEGLIVKAAYHSHKNMKKVHKAQGRHAK